SRYAFLFPLPTPTAMEDWSAGRATGDIEELGCPPCGESRTTSVAAPNTIPTQTLRSRKLPDEPARMTAGGRCSRWVNPASMAREEAADLPAASSESESSAASSVDEADLRRTLRGQPDAARLTAR